MALLRRLSAVDNAATTRKPLGCLHIGSGGASEMQVFPFVLMRAVRFGCGGAGHRGLRKNNAASWQESRILTQLLGETQRHDLVADQVKGPSSKRRPQEE